MKTVFLPQALLAAALLLTGCGVHHRQALPPAQQAQVEKSLTLRARPLPKELEQRILALNPTNVTVADVRDVLSHAPAPRIINIHGGIARVVPRMVSFSEFLVGMGYPAASVTNPADGTYSFSCYESSEKIAGVIAWFYEKEGLRPILVGHSQGGMQVVKVLHQLNRKPTSPRHVWNPLSWEKENRCEILDPVTGRMQPVAGLQLAFATSVGAGGLTRLLPNQWDMAFRLRSIPGSIEEFTGFCKGADLLGGDYLGYGPANHYEADNDEAVVRNVWLPSEYKHGQIPSTRHLLEDPAMVQWINEYRPDDRPVSRPEVTTQFAGDSSGLVWAAEVWFSIRKHWVLELQRWIRSRGNGEGHSS